MVEIRTASGPWVLADQLGPELEAEQPDDLAYRQRAVDELIETCRFADAARTSLSLVVELLERPLSADDRKTIRATIRKVIDS